MQHTVTRLSHQISKVSICDACIGSIQHLENAIRFIFPEGFFIVSDDEVIKSSFGYIELSDCTANDVFCYFFRRSPSPQGAILQGDPLSTVELAELLERKDHILEIFMELYDFNCLHWRGVLLPCTTEGLSDHVTIEAYGEFLVTYFWE